MKFQITSQYGESGACYRGYIWFKIKKTVDIENMSS